jgi:GTP-binding protein HflX
MSTAKTRTDAVVLAPALKGPRGVGRTSDPQARLDEAVGLARAIGLLVGQSQVVPVSRPRPDTLLSGGKVEEVREQVSQTGAQVVIVDHPLSPVQQRNLERAWNAKVLDRTGLILEIFGERAQTKEGRLQVELAHLSYQKSRLVRSWTHLERQRGGRGFMGGPGERQIEADRRQIQGRIDVIRRKLADVRRTRGLHREGRKRSANPVVALVGYTNAGKSTLFNRLTGETVAAKDQLFATLDPTMRAVRLPNGQGAILSDTVGFIADLPTTLVAAFRATLEEVTEADLILHVRDIAAEQTETQKQDVEAVLEELGVDPSPGAGRVIEVWNKADLLSPEDRAAVSNHAQRREVAPVLISATTGEGISDLLERLAAHFADASQDTYRPAAE